MTYAYDQGANACFAESVGAAMAILQPRSPSCGVTQIYDGSFSGRLVDGSGIFAHKLLEAHITTFDVDDPAALDELKSLLSKAEENASQKQETGA